MSNAHHGAHVPARATLPMSVANMTFLVNKLGEDCAPLQFVRELTQNGIEAVVQQGSPGEVVWDVAWHHFDLDGTYKLACIDTGAGMTGPEMGNYHLDVVGSNGRGSRRCQRRSAR